MTPVGEFDVIGLTLPRLPDAALAIAVARAGGIGVLDFEWGIAESFAESEHSECIRDNIRKLARFAKGRWGIKFNGEDELTCGVAVDCLTSSFELAILTHAPTEVLSRQVARLRTAVHSPKHILLEVTDGIEICSLPGLDGFVAKGHESGGLVGGETTFILLQRLLRLTTLQIWVQGGIGLHTAAACRAANAAGVVLDSQLSLTRESVLPESVRRIVARMDGSESAVVAGGLRHQLRCYHRLGSTLNQVLREAARELEGVTTGQISQLRKLVGPLIGWKDSCIWPLGQDAAFASGLAGDFETAGKVVLAIRESAKSHISSACMYQPLAEGSALAKSHGTQFPIVQGPMTRVTDNAAFAEEVAQAGALPFIALALSNAAETREVLDSTRARLGTRPWGAGILGFVPLEVRVPQLEVIREVKPSFALIAGGRPDQAIDLEREGIATYLHIPSPGLLKVFFEQGARRFVFEGRECGGHVGPRCSFPLWDAMIEMLLSLRLSGAGLSDVHVLFAGGIHDAFSASLVATLSAPLAEVGVKIGVLLGTAYLFTREIVARGGITPTFQAEALQCTGTALLESGPGHASRCARTGFVSVFEAERRRLTTSDVSTDEMLRILEELNLGRLRLAAKGLRRPPSDGFDTGKPKLERACGGEQRASGMYMLGQLAALRNEVCSIEDLHRDVSVRGSARLSALSSPRSVSQKARPCDVAIVGLATLMPKAQNATRFWENILAKVDAITEIPPNRFDWHKYYDADPATPDMIYSKWGGFLDDIAFDPVSYGMPPHALASIEPMQLLTLEAVRAAINDAGYTDRPFLRSRTSVILGVGGGLADLGQQYGVRSGLPSLAGSLKQVPVEMLERLPSWTEDSFAGLLLNVVAGRVANRFDLGGVNFTVDAACASALAAIYSAVSELELGSSDVVIAGGVDTVQNPFGYLCFSKTKALSPRGRCRPFDADADGIVISEGLAVLVLKRLADAERDGDRVYAVIKSIAGSSDGRAKGLTAPRPEGQIAALGRAYERAGISPTTVGLIEAHGTGTVAGDLAEAEALKRVFTGARPRTCAIGSVKSMIGHTKCAAGAAGLVKAAIALHEKVLPPTLHVQKPNPKVDFDHSPFYLNTETRPWFARVDRVPRRAGVSAFGFGGTNFHLVLEEYTDDPAPERRKPIAVNWPSELLVWSAESYDSLRTQVSELIRELSTGAEPALVDLAFTTWEDAKHSGSTRLAIIAGNLSDLGTKLAAVEGILATTDVPDVIDQDGIYLRRSNAGSERGKLAYLFPGQGSQQVGMLADLAIYFTEVREYLEEADLLLAEEIPEGLSSYIFPPPSITEEDIARCTRNLSRTEITQPAMGAACLAMSRLLDCFGVRPDVLAGHSYGEYVALAVAGVFTTKSLFTLSAARGKYLAETADPGAMLAVLEQVESVTEIIKGIAGVWIANINSPQQTILSGTHDGISAAKERLSRNHVDCMAVPVSCAFHSPLVERAKESLAAVLSRIEFLPPLLPVYSNTTGSKYPKNADAVAALLTEHLINPVRFQAEIEEMYFAGVRTFIEVGPRSVLTRLVSQTLGKRPHMAVATGGDRSTLAQLQRALARLIVEGIPISLDRLYRNRVSRRLDLALLLEKSRHAELTANTWLVNGGRARRVGEPVMRPTTPTAFPSQPKRETVLAEQSPEFAGSSQLDEKVMIKFQETMTRFLETQQRTMTAYFQGQEATLSSPAAWQPEPFAAVEDASTDVEHREAGTINATNTTDKRLSIGDQLRNIISDRTGYPVDMLKSALNLEADLGIDSIKRVEILGAFQKSCEESGQQKLRREMDKLTSLKTIGGLEEGLTAVLENGNRSLVNSRAAKSLSLDTEAAERLSLDAQAAESLPLDSRAAEPVSLDAEAAAEPVPLDSKAAEPLPPDSKATESLPLDSKATEPLPRFVLRSIPSAPVPPFSNALPKGAILITDDKRGIAFRLATELRDRGWPSVVVQANQSPTATWTYESLGRAFADISKISEVEPLIETVRRSHGCIAGILHLLPLAKLGCRSWQKRLALETKGLFLLAKAVETDLRAHRQPRAFLLAATCLGGDFGLTASGGAPEPVQGGVPGIVKTLALEWPEVACRVVDFEDTVPSAEAAERILAELSDTGEVEIGYKNGERLRLRASPARLAEGGGRIALFDNSPVILATGGARGITAKCLVALASRFPARYLIVGKSSRPSGAEAAHTASVTSPRELKGMIIEQIRRDGRNPEPAQVEATCARLLHDREIRQNLRAITETGAVVCYWQCDLASAVDFTRLLEKVYSTYGAIHGVIHGAGVIEDRLIADKTVDSFDRVIAAKVTAAMVLAQHLRPDDLRFLAFFSSVSGRFGNRGQVDYAAANEILNKIAAKLDAQWPARVVAINWGPWGESNMVNDALRDQFLLRGVELIRTSAGCNGLIQELLAGRKGESEVILGDGPWRETPTPPLPQNYRKETPLVLVNSKPVASTPGSSISFVTQLELSRHRYLTDHCLDTRPVLPATMAIEFLAAAALKVRPDFVITGLKSVRVFKGIVADGPCVPICISVEPPIANSAKDRGLVAHVDIHSPDRRSRIFYRGAVCLAEHLPAAPPLPFRRGSLGSSTLKAVEAYHNKLFHGPRFQCLKQDYALDRNGVRAYVSPSSPADCIEGAQGAWVIDPVLLDAGPQLMILWARETLGMTVLPSLFGEVKIFNGFSGALITGVFQPLECRLVVEKASSGPIITGNFHVFDATGQLVLSLEGLECTGNQALNRLAVRRSATS